MKSAPVMVTVVESGPLLGLKLLMDRAGGAGCVGVGGVECLEQAVSARVANSGRVMAFLMVNTVVGL